MVITIEYKFYTDGDYGLRTPENFGCVGKDVEMDDISYNYVGVMTFENEDEGRCKSEAKSFLAKLLCDGIHISYTHHYLMKSFYEKIEMLMSFIDRHNQGISCVKIDGNQEGTEFIVYMKNT